MHEVTLALVSQDSALARLVGEVVAPIRGIMLEVVPDHGLLFDRIARHEVAIVVTHLGTAGDVSGLTRLLSTAQAAGQKVPVLVLSEDYNAQQALGLLRLGVIEYLSRPLDLGRLGYLIDVLTLENRKLSAPVGEAAATALGPAIALEESFLTVPGGGMDLLIEQIRRIAPQDTTILLGGATGTGKSRLAGVIHRLSPRRDRPFLTINCGALSANLIESEMFGHVKGAFTGADSHRAGKFSEVGRGTLFLDEIDSLPPELQAKLLRAVEDRVFEPVGSNQTQALQARLIVASNRPLDVEVHSGRFRADLYYRLNVIAFHLPRLQERGEVIIPLAEMFLSEFGRRAGRVALSLDEDVTRALRAHSWPGNIRELRNVIERAVALSDGPAIRLEDLPEPLRALGAVVVETARPIARAATLFESREQHERVRITAALERNGNNRLRAAAELGISRMTLYKKLHKLGLMPAT